MREDRARVRAAATSLPRRARLDVARFAPSGPSLLVGFLLLAAAIASYGIARETPLFAIQRVDVVGPPEVRARVRAALEPLRGKTLVGLQPGQVDGLLAGVPEVAGATYDRAFPHTLRIFVLAERPLLVLRRGDESWLVSVRGRVLRKLAPHAVAHLPRLWVSRSVDVARGASLADATSRRGVRLLAAVSAEIPTGVRTVRFDGDDAFVVLRNGVEVRLGSERDLRLKLAVAATLLPRVADYETYLDVAVPSRPVAGQRHNAQVEVEP